MKVLLGACVLLAALAPTSAEAKCGSPSTTVSPLPGSTVPIDPTLYLFVPRSRSTPTVTAVDGEGKTLSVAVVAQPAPPSGPVQLSGQTEPDPPVFVPWRIDVLAPAGGRFTLQVRFPVRPVGEDEVPFEFNAHYTVGTSREVPTGPLRVESVKAVSNRWTCSYNELQRITISQPAAAYEMTVELVGKVHGSVAQALGQPAGPTTFIVPPAMRDFWVGHESWMAPAEERRQINLGHSDCIGSTWFWAGWPLTVSIAALHANGSRQRLAQAIVVSPPPRQAGWSD